MLGLALRFSPEKSLTHASRNTKAKASNKFKSLRRKTMSRKLKFAIFVLTVCLFSVASVAAQTEQCSDLNTATGQPGWMLISGPGINAPKVPVNVSPYPGWQSPSLPGSSWVSTDPNHGGSTGDYTYEYTFCVCKNGKHALNLSFYADNGAVVFLDNTQIFTTAGSYNFNGAARTVNYGWVGGPGISKVRIVVHNDSGPTGLNAVLRISGASTGTCCSDLSTATGQPGWTLSSGPGLNSPILPVNVGPYSGWQSPTLPGSSWISVDANRGSLPGNYAYDFPFCVCDGGKHQLNLSFYADNGAQVFLNNTQIFATSGVYNFNGAAKVVNYNWAGGPGQNILRILVSNQGSVTGLDAVLQITGATAGRCGRAVGAAIELGQPALVVAPGRVDPIKRPNN
jgi:hypothetical protein